MYRHTHTHKRTPFACLWGQSLGRREWKLVVGKSRGNTHLSSETPLWLTYPPPSSSVSFSLSLSLSLSLGVLWMEIFPRGSSFQPPDYYLWTELSQLATCTGEIQHTHINALTYTHPGGDTPREHYGRGKWHYQGTRQLWGKRACHQSGAGHVRAVTWER